MATANGLYNTAGTVHSGYYSKQISRQFETAHLLSAPCSEQQYLTHVQSETFLAEQ
jgi:hypothetical protein